MKYLKTFNENKKIVTSKSTNTYKNLIDTEEKRCFEIILESIKSIFRKDLDLLLEEINNQKDIYDWISWIQKHTVDEAKERLGNQFLENYFYNESTNENKKRLIEYVKNDLYHYITDNT